MFQPLTKNLLLLLSNMCSTSISIYFPYIIHWFISSPAFKMRYFQWPRSPAFCTSWSCRKLWELCGSKAISTMLGRSCRGCSKAWAAPSRAAALRCGSDVVSYLLNGKKLWNLPICLKMWEIPNYRLTNSNDMFLVEDLMECDGLGLKHRTWWMIWMNFHHDKIYPDVEICWNMLKYVEICGNMWKYVEICGNMWKYVEICGNMWKYVEICFNMCFNMFFNDQMKNDDISVPSSWNPPAETLQLRRSSWNSPPPTARHPDRSSNVGRPRSRPTTLGPSRNEPSKKGSAGWRSSWKSWESSVKFHQHSWNSSYMFILSINFQ